MPQMTAVWYDRVGPAAEVLQLGLLDMPVLSPGEVRVKLRVVGVNPADVKRRGGWNGVTMNHPRIVPGDDGAGVIVEVGAGVDPRRIGQRVWVYNARVDRPFGSSATHVTLPERRAVPLPDGTSDDLGACLGIPAITAHRCLFADGPITGKTVLVTGGAGAVGSMAIGLAKWGGATVFTTVSSPEKAVAARRLGADHVIDYRAENVAERVAAMTGGAGVNRVVEVAFGDNVATLPSIVSNGGVVASYSAGNEHRPALPFYPLMMKNITIRLVIVYTIDEGAKEAAARDITGALKAGRLAPLIAARYPLAELALAHDAVDSGRLLGQALIDIPQ